VKSAQASSGGPLLVAVGRLMIDIWSRLAVDGFDKGDWIGEINEVRVDVGGPVHTCEGFLNAQGHQAVLVSAIGARRVDLGQLVPDDLGSLALNRLEAKGINASCMLVEHKQTGRVMLLYPPNGGRLMVSDIVTAPRVSGEWVETVIGESLTDRDWCLIYVDGYLYFDPSASDVLAVLARRKQDSSLLWVDVLPHTLYKVMSLADFLHRAQNLDLLTMDRTTLEGFAAENSLKAEAVISALLQRNTVVAIVDENILTIYDHHIRHVIACPQMDERVMGQTPGARDKLVAELVSRYLLNRRQLERRLCP
jgi:sugar/nucleoside kinase (ribokinase family)